MAGITITPELIAQLTTLIVALTALVRVLMTHGTVQQTQAQVQKTAADVATIKEQTNGTLEEVQRQNAALRAHLPAAAPLRRESAPPEGPPAA